MESENVKKVYQTKFGENGNCLQASLATIFGCELSDVPAFDNKDTWWSDLQNWLRKQGYIALNWEIKDLEISKMNFPRGVLCLFAGISSRGLLHSVVAKDGELWHDPHPDGDGIDQIHEYTLILPLKYEIKIIGED